MSNKQKHANGERERERERERDGEREKDGREKDLEVIITLRSGLQEKQV